MDAHAQDFVANDELLLPILKVFVPRLLINTQFTLLLHERLMFLGLCIEEQPVACTSSLSCNQCTPPDTSSSQRGLFVSCH
jgi:hypothetical protein